MEEPPPNTLRVPVTLHLSRRVLKCILKPYPETRTRNVFEAFTTAFSERHARLLVTFSALQ